MTSPVAAVGRAGRAASISRKEWARLASAYLVLGATALAFSQAAGLEDWWWHGLWCFSGLVIAVPLLSRTFRLGFTVVLTDHRLMFLWSFSLYFLVGAALLAIGPQSQIDASTSDAVVNAPDALRVDGMNGLGFGIALLTAAFVRGRRLGTLAGRAAAAVSRLPTSWVLAFFLVSASLTSYYVLLVDLGIRHDVVPGLVRSAGRMSIVAIFLAASRVGRGERSLRFFAIMLAVVLALAGVVQFNKTATLLPLAALVGGLALRFGTRRVLPIGAVVLVTIFLVLGNVASLGRTLTVMQGSTTIWERVAAARDAWELSKDPESAEEYAYWARLCYVPTQAASLQLWDDGWGGDGFQLMFWVFVPRFLAAEKPEISKTGQDLNEKIRGYRSSSDLPGIFISGYYSGGWWGFLLASALCGWIVAQTSAIAKAIQARQGVLMLPFSLLGLLIAFRIDGEFVSDYLGTFVFILYPLLAAAVFLGPGTVARRRVANAPGDVTA